MCRLTTWHIGARSLGWVPVEFGGTKRNELMTDAIAFYEENAAYVAAYGLSNLDRESRLLFRQGKRLVQDAIATVQRAPRRNCGPVTWTPAELDFITDLYLKHVRPEQEHDARATILREFRTRFQTHSDDAVELTVRRIIRLDTAYPSEGMLGAHVGYWEILESKAPGRFDPPAVAN